MYKIVIDQVAKVPWWVWGIAALGVAAFVLKKGGLSPAIADVTAGAVSGAGSVVDGVASGVILGIGDVLGVPRTNETKCQKAMREGNNWNASFYCDAATFLRWNARGAQKTIEDLF